jgi:hypothetical protein
MKKREAIIIGFDSEVHFEKNEIHFERIESKNPFFINIIEIIFKNLLYFINSFLEIPIFFMCYIYYKSSIISIYIDPIIKNLFLILKNLIFYFIMNRKIFYEAFSNY